MAPMTTEDRVSWSLLCMTKGKKIGKSLQSMKDFHNGHLSLSHARTVLNQFVEDGLADRKGSGLFQITTEGRRAFIKRFGKEAFDQEKLKWDLDDKAKAKARRPRATRTLSARRACRLLLRAIFLPAAPPRARLRAPCARRLRAPHAAPRRAAGRPAAPRRTPAARTRTSAPRTGRRDRMRRGAQVSSPKTIKKKKAAPKKKKEAAEPEPEEEEEGEDTVDAGGSDEADGEAGGEEASEE